MNGGATVVGSLRDHCERRPLAYNVAVPKRTGIKNILIIGSGPIVIGQGAEFYYSGTQACKALRELSLLQPPSGIAHSRGDARDIARRVGYPVLVRPSYVLGGRGMKVCNNDSDLDGFLQTAFAAGDRIGLKSLGDF